MPLAAASSTMPFTACGCTVGKSQGNESQAAAGEGSLPHQGMPNCTCYLARRNCHRPLPSPSSHQRSQSRQPPRARPPTNLAHCSHVAVPLQQRLGCGLEGDQPIHLVDDGLLGRNEFEAGS